MKQSDVNRYARALMSWHRDHAGQLAARRVERFLAQGDESSARSWQKIERRILEWKGEERPRSLVTRRNEAHSGEVHTLS